MYINFCCMSIKLALGTQVLKNAFDSSIPDAVFEHLRAYNIDKITVLFSSNRFKNESKIHSG